MDVDWMHLSQNRVRQLNTAVKIQIPYMAGEFCWLVEPFYTKVAHIFGYVEATSKFWAP